MFHCKYAGQYTLHFFSAAVNNVEVVHIKLNKMTNYIKPTGVPMIFIIITLYSTILDISFLDHIAVIYSFICISIYFYIFIYIFLYIYIVRPSLL